jgi:lipopolysaccharide export system permease protein
VNPRGGRSSNLIFGLLAFVVYNNLLNLGQSWIFVGLISFGNFLVALHGGVFLLAVMWLIKRNSNWVLRPAPRLKRPPLPVRSNNSLAA